MTHPARHLSDLVTERRSLLKAGGLLAVSAASPVTFGALLPRAKSSLAYASLPQVIGLDHEVAHGYRARVLISWGDLIDPKALRESGGKSRFNPTKLDAEGQKRRFGTSNDFLAFLPLPRGSQNSSRGLLWSNHEYPAPVMMFAKSTQSAEQVAITQAAVGGSVIEVERGGNGDWSVVAGSARARRVHVGTRMGFGGPGATSKKLQLTADPGGGHPYADCGTLGNCAGGKTPWGTILSGEENFQSYFGNGPEDYEPETKEGEVNINFDSKGGWVTGSYGWEKHDERFDLSKNSDGPCRYGWVVEVDPYSPGSIPVKRTALGRMKHEGATTTVTRDADGKARVVVYTGDDQIDACLYRFVSEPTEDPSDPVANRDLLDRGVLSVARFDREGVTWVPLVAGEGELAKHTQFASQEDVALRTREAARAVGATPMDRPEDVETNPVNGRVYVALTNHSGRSKANAANPREKNKHGHILELYPPPGYGEAADHTADRYQWTFLLLGGDPSQPDSGAVFHPDSEAWLSCPDNVAFDPLGRLWIATDQGGNQAKNGIPDGIYTMDVDGAGRCLAKLFFAGPIGCEVCGPEFTPDGSTLFVSVQHPGDGTGMTYLEPATRWPDFASDLPPRPSIVAIGYEKDRGRVLGEEE
ncbi:MAG: PhoX family phosphatase [Planctomycetota bacterium]|nr:PhoX family phosphatase [Planctomycetota bacterium]